MEIRDRILKESDHLFRTYGIRSITMDEIARNLAISKKTIYQYFTDKEDLIVAMMHASLEEHRNEWANIQRQARDAVEELIIAAEHLAKTFKSMNPALLYELRKYHPKAWEVFLQHKQEHVRRQVIDNLDRGIASGLFRREINVELIAQMRLDQVEWGFGAARLDAFKQLSVGDIQLQLLDHFMHGIVTLKGYSLLIKYRQQQHQLPSTNT